MKKKLIVIMIGILSTFTQQANAQYGDLGIRARFDEVYNSYYVGLWDSWDPYQMYHGNSTNSMYHQNRLGSTLTGSLDALLIMYEATCDKWYLYEFMRKATLVQNDRADRTSPQMSTAPYWFKDQVPWHGRLLMPLAHFVVLVNEKGIGGMTLPNDPSNPNQFGGHTTVGSFSSWINQSNIEVMDFLLPKFWRGENECMCKPRSGATGCPSYNDVAINKVCTSSYCNTGGLSQTKSISELNFQAPYGSSLLYMFIANPGRTDYGSKVVQMARAYLIEDGGILTYHSGAQGYTWHHDGWQQSRNNPWSAWQHETGDGVEDIGHGGWDIQFPILYNKYYSNITGVITGNQYFEDYQLVRFKNTFSQLIFDDTNYPNSFNSTTFNLNIDGTNTATAANTGLPQNSITFQASSKPWVELYKFDNVPGAIGYDVYDIMMQFYDQIDQYYTINDAAYGGLKIRGLALMVAANYDRENIIPEDCLIHDYPAERRNPINNSVTLFPNPANDLLSISIDSDNYDNDETLEIKFVDLRGTTVLETTELNNINVSNLPKGLYFVHINTSEATWKKTLTIK